MHSSRAPNRLCSNSIVVTKTHQFVAFLFADYGTTSAMAAATGMDSVQGNRETKNLRRWIQQSRIPYSNMSSVIAPKTIRSLSGLLSLVSLTMSTHSPRAKTVSALRSSTNRE
ncbi:hypothetical protein AAC387_Pa04g1788 [Persea americana]